jgi:hypothetical protein
MVNDDGQLYTIEGVSAGLIMLLTAYFVLNSTSIYTPGDSHINDMQLEVLGYDALLMMNTPANNTMVKSPLQEIVEQDDGQRFKTMFMNLTNNKTGSTTDRLQFSANYTYRIQTASTQNATASAFLSSSRPYTEGEHAVRVTKWVIVDKPLGSTPVHNRAVLVEVLLWRDA